MSILDFTKSLFKQKSIKDNAKDFVKQAEIIPKLYLYYLAIWFKQIFESPDFIEKGFKKDFYLVLAAQVSKYLMGNDIHKTESENAKQKLQIEMANKHVEKWADDVMNKDNQFCEFVVQTLRMQFIFTAYFKGTEEALKIESNRVNTLLQKYGGMIPVEPTPTYYTKLFQKFLRWYATVKEEGLIDKIEKDY